MNIINSVLAFLIFRISPNIVRRWRNNDSHIPEEESRLLENVNVQVIKHKHKNLLFYNNLYIKLDKK